MDSGTYAFGEFSLDLGDRRLRRAGEPVELSSRYFDALALLLGEPGKLVSKARFMDEVWRGVPVTDEALTQCIRTLRRQLGDDAASPRFIETVPKHGYRFIAAVERRREEDRKSQILAELVSGRRQPRQRLTEGHPATTKPGAWRPPSPSKLGEDLNGLDDRREVEPAVAGRVDRFVAFLRPAAHLRLDAGRRNVRLDRAHVQRRAAFE